MELQIPLEIAGRVFAIVFRELAPLGIVQYIGLMGVETFIQATCGVSDVNHLAMLAFGCIYHIPCLVLTVTPVLSFDVDVDMFFSSFAALGSTSYSVGSCF